MINQASPEGVNGEPSTLFTMNLNSNPITTQANVRRSTSITTVLLFGGAPHVVLTLLLCVSCGGGAVRAAVHAALRHPAHHAERESVSGAGPLPHHGSRPFTNASCFLSVCLCLCAVRRRVQAQELRGLRGVGHQPGRHRRGVRRHRSCMHHALTAADRASPLRTTHLFVSC